MMMPSTLILWLVRYTRDHPITDGFVLHNAPHFEVKQTTSMMTFSDWVYVAIKRAEEIHSGWMVRQLGPMLYMLRDLSVKGLGYNLALCTRLKVNIWSLHVLAYISITGGWWHISWGGQAHCNGWNGINWMVSNTWFPCVWYHSIQSLLWACPPLTSLLWLAYILELDIHLYVWASVSTNACASMYTWCKYYV